MITRLEATRYRCFERLAVDVGEFRVLVGSNGSGKTTLLDLSVLIGDMLQATNIATPFMERRPYAPPRASSLNELVFAGRGTDFSFGIEARFPEAVQTKVVQGMVSKLRTEKSQRALQEDPSRWPTHIRYELGLRIVNDIELQVISEYLFMFPESKGPDRRIPGFHGVFLDDQKFWRPVLNRSFDSDTKFTPEVLAARSRKAAKVGLPKNLLAMPRVMFESETEYPASRWLYGLLTEGAVFLDPNWSEMRLASPPGQPKTITSTGRNIPWLALDLKRSGGSIEKDTAYQSQRFQDWIDHVKTALPQVADIDVREREDDHHAYFVVSYRGGFSVTSSGLSDGTLRILTLTLLPYLNKAPAILVTEEPENGIHPRAIEAVLQSLSSMYNSQVWVSSHSPIVLASAKLDQLLCSRISSEGGVGMVAGPDHPRLQEWRGGIDLGSLFAAGVLG